MESRSLCSGRLFAQVEAVTELDISVVVSYRGQPPSRHGLSTVGLEDALDFSALQVQTLIAVNSGVSTSCKRVGLRVNIFHGALLSTCFHVASPPLGLRVRISARSTNYSFLACSHAAPGLLVLRTLPSTFILQVYGYSFSSTSSTGST